MAVVVTSSRSGPERTATRLRFLKPVDRSVWIFVSLQDIEATGGASFSATNSLDLGNNLGWTISSPAARALFWVGGTGNWSDANHWSISSGGIGGECLPNFMDDVRFDANSGFGPGGSVTIDVAEASCHNMDWTGAPNTPQLIGGNSNKIQVFGSLTLITNMVNNLAGDFLMLGTTSGLGITSAGHVFTGELILDGTGGEWSLQDDISFNGGDLRHQDGTFLTQNFNINIEDGDLRLSGQAADLGTSTIILCSSSLSTSNAINLNAQNAEFEFNCSGGDMDGGDHTYKNVTFNAIGSVYDADITGSLIFNNRGDYNGDDNEVNYIEFQQRGDINGETKYFPYRYI